MRSPFCTRPSFTSTRHTTPLQQKEEELASSLKVYSMAAQSWVRHARQPERRSGSGSSSVGGTCTITMLSAAH